MTDTLYRRVDEHERQIAGFRADMNALKTEVHTIKEGQNLIFAEMKQVGQALAALNANRPLPTMDVLRTAMSMAVSVTVLVSAVIASIIYVSSNANNGTLTSLQKDVDMLVHAASPAEVAVMRHRIGELERSVTAIGEHAPWAPQIKFAERK